MFGFDKAYSLKCLASDKPGRFCQNRLWLTWEFSFTHTSVCKYIWTHVAHHPGTHQCHFNTLWKWDWAAWEPQDAACEGIASPWPQICRGSQCPWKGTQGLSRATPNVTLLHCSQPTLDTFSGTPWSCPPPNLCIGWFFLPPPLFFCPRQSRWAFKNPVEMPPTVENFITGNQPSALNAHPRAQPPPSSYKASFLHSQAASRETEFRACSTQMYTPQSLVTQGHTKQWWTEKKSYG